MSTDQKRLLLIDGHSMAYRAFYALPAENFKTSSGQPTNAIYGFASMLINLIKEEKPTHIAVAFDVSRKTFRTQLFTEYKANRASTPDEFRSQMSFINEMIDCFGIKHFEMEGYEADDIIATFAKSAEKNGNEVEIKNDKGERTCSARITCLILAERHLIQILRRSYISLIYWSQDAPKRFSQLHMM